MTVPSWRCVDQASHNWASEIYWENLPCGQDPYVFCERAAEFCNFSFHQGRPLFTVTLTERMHERTSGIAQSDLSMSFVVLSCGLAQTSAESWSLLVPRHNIGKSVCCSSCRSRTLSDKTKPWEISAKRKDEQPWADRKYTSWGLNVTRKLDEALREFTHSLNAGVFSLLLIKRKKKKGWQHRDAVFFILAGADPSCPLCSGRLYPRPSSCMAQGPGPSFLHHSRKPSSFFSRACLESVLKQARSFSLLTQGCC